MRICQWKKKLIKIERTMRGYNVSDKSTAQEEHRVQKWSEGLIYVGITWHILVQCSVLRQLRYNKYGKQ